MTLSGVRLSSRRVVGLQKSRRDSVVSRAGSLVPGLVVTMAWEILSASGALPAEVPTASAVFNWLFQNAGSRAFLEPVSMTMTHWAAGLGLGVISGLLLGVTIGASKWIYTAAIVPLEFFRVIPAIVYLPLALLIMGRGTSTAVLLVGLGTMFPMLFQTYYGIRSVDDVALETGRVYGLTWLQRTAFITLPSTLPFVATGIRIASSLALIVAIAVEMLGAAPGGMGVAMIRSMIAADYPAMYAFILFAGIIGWLLSTGFGGLQAKLLVWHTPHREGRA